MSVIKAKRKPSQFEVFHQFYKMRKEVTDLLLRDFGYDLERAKKEILKRNFGGRSYEELNPEEKDRYEKLVEKEQAFADWFIKDERQAVVDCLRTIGEEVFTANSIYPTYIEELIERRLHQDRAIGQCYRLTQELQYAIETLPVDVNKYLRFADMIKDEINFIKGWRKSDNKFKSSFVGSTVKEQLIMLLSKIIGLLENRAISDSASNFANVNNNGNANYNNASNSNGVRPDFDSVIE
jgi:hypothetical protein